MSFLDPPPLAIAHRGGAATGDNVGIENSLAAFAHAYELGYRYLETDVRTTSDGVVYAVHDDRLERLTGSPDAINALSSESIELQRLDQREPFARLEALFEAFPDARLMIDVKSDEAVEPTCELVRAQGAIGRTCLSSFSHARLRRIRRLLPGVATSASVPEVVMATLLPARLLRILGAPPGTCLQVPHRQGPLPVVTRSFVRRAHALGKQVHVWTVDDADEMNELLDLGVDGIITDRTDVLKDVLVARGTWTEPA
ncbi:glycerophosphodiester phosphodiesterase family protein [Aeromicrobium chenweiae]|uniref:Glycerophosphodiester phosphodiesterase n=1 Tax=Aeromicrobium chenweiae TaxID=2079793 RepID=A0A2S0WM74_9ACTN|nr:glycerophosphodiester phosphodiesterase family protein [Aeromicrobium chenweiae]AWB92402.1 glycerophosphodiester phosphodiesterase [Aeromicrobium chenweiae]TGN31311.1 glycerophosphodiester phosphodiesterase [Aeromicrobium chenweiae]